jgi:hypothetical protein
VDRPVRTGLDVREAARRTLDAGTARVSTRTFFDPPVSHQDPRVSRLIIAAMETSAEGVADLSRRRARLATSLSPATERLTERIVARWPWLDEGEDDDDAEEEPEFDTVFIGGDRYFGAGARWILADDGKSAPTANHPTWIIEALAGATGARRVGTEEVRRAACERYALDPVDLSAAAASAAIALPPHGGLTGPTLRGDVWIDGDGLVRRVTWTQPLRGRRRLRPKQTGPRMWRSTELWDFGLPVTIDVPEAEPRPEPIPLRHLVADLWSMRRRYRRRYAQR